MPYFEGAEEKKRVFILMFVPYFDGYFYFCMCFSGNSLEESQLEISCLSELA